jgi:hypothetical protein
MARSLIQCGLVEQGENILRDLNQDFESEGREALPRPRYVVKSTTAELFDNIFNVNEHRLPLEGDLERERMNAMRETAKEVEARWQTTVHATALQHTRDMWKLHHDADVPTWGAPRSSGGAAVGVAPEGAVKPASMLKTLSAWEQERQQSRARDRERAKDAAVNSDQRSATPPPPERLLDRPLPPQLPTGAAETLRSPAGPPSVPSSHSGLVCHEQYLRREPLFSHPDTTPCADTDCTAVDTVRKVLGRELVFAESFSRW